MDESQKQIETLKKTIDSVKIEKKGMEGDYRWIIIKTPQGKEVKMQEGYGEDLFRAKKEEEMNPVEDAAKLIKYIKMPDGKTHDSKDITNEAMHKIIGRFPSYELQPIINASYWFSKECVAPEEYPFRPEDYK